jgi:hypothetical protein
MTEGHNLLPQGPLTDAETIALRVMLRDYNRSRWLGRLLIRWIAYLSATIAALAALKDHIAALFSKGG